MEDRAGGDRFLVVAAGAFVNARTLLQLPCLTAAAPRTDVAARPSQAGQVFEALFLGAEARHEFEEPVHPILRHHPTGMLPQREQLCKNIRRTCFSWIGRSAGSLSNCSMIPATRSIAVTLNAHSLTAYPFIYGDAHIRFVCSEA